jgi:hypothetical protein
MSASSLLRGSVAGAARLSAPACRARRAAAARPTRAAAASSAELVPTSVTLTKLKESGKLTKNVDGALLSRACAWALARCAGLRRANAQRRFLRRQPAVAVAATCRGATPLSAAGRAARPRARPLRCAA